MRCPFCHATVVATDADKKNIRLECSYCGTNFESNLLKYPHSNSVGNQSHYLSGDPIDNPRITTTCMAV